MSARVIPERARRMASFTGSQRPRTGQIASASQAPVPPSTQAVRAIGPSMATITSDSGTDAKGRVRR